MAKSNFPFIDIFREEHGLDVRNAILKEREADIKAASVKAIVKSRDLLKRTKSIKAQKMPRRAREN